MGPILLLLGARSGWMQLLQDHPTQHRLAYMVQVGRRGHSVVDRLLQLASDRHAPSALPIKLVVFLG